MESMLRMLLECTISMSLVALLLMALTPLLERRYSARGLYIAWLVVIAGFLVPWRPHVPTAAIRVTVPPAQVLPIGNAARPNPQQPVGPSLQMPQTDVPAEQTATEPAAPQAANSFTLPEITTTELLGVIYLAGAVVVAGIRLWHHRRFVRSVRRWSRPVQSRVCLEALAEACHEMGIKQKPVLLRCQSIDSPMLIGLFHPRILVPDTRFSLAEFGLVLRHELTHLKRHDLWGRLLLMLASVLHWFNPLMPVFARFFSLRCELSCDAEVMHGMDMDTRQYYSETIIHSLRIRPSAATALSTRYHGGKKSMKKRIFSIFDIRRKKLGVALVSLMLCASLGAGMAFALQTAGETPEPAGSPVAAASEPATDEERAYALNVLWARTLENVFGSYSVLNQTSLRSYMLAYDAVNETEYERIREVLLAAKDGQNVIAIMQSDDFEIVQPTGEVRAFAQSMIDDAGYQDWTIDNFTFILYPSGFHDDMSEATSFSRYWRVDVIEDPQEDSSLASFWLQGDDRLQRMEYFSVYQHEAVRELTQEERDQVRERVMEYMRTYLRSGPDDVMMQSDMVYVQEGVSEPYTAVYYNENQQDDSQGRLILIGVETGRLYEISWAIEVESFVNTWHAERDWTETTGKAFPYPNEAYLWDVVGMELRELLYENYAKYSDTLSDQEQLLFYALYSEDAAALVAPNAHWQELMTVLRACETEADFKAFLTTPFIGVNQSPPDEPQAAVILKRAEPTFEAFGAGEMRNRAFMYSSAFTANAPGRYALSAMDTYQQDNKYKASFIMTVSVDKEGLATGMYHPYIYGDGVRVVETTDEQKEQAQNIARTMIESGRIALATYDLNTLRVADQAETWTDNITRVTLTAHAIFWETDENGDRMDEYVEGLLSMTVGLEDGRLYGLERYFEDIQGAEEYIHTLWNR